jgi:hypothetical protein
MVNLEFINNKFKMVIGIIAILLCLIVFFITPSYVEFYLIFIFLIPAIALIIPNDSIRNFKIMGVITLILVAIVAYFAINGMFNAYDILTNMYVSGLLDTLPVTSDIDACYMGYLMVLLNALFNIITAVLFFIPTAEDDF